MRSEQFLIAAQAVRDLAHALIYAVSKGGSPDGPDLLP